MQNLAITTKRKLYGKVVNVDTYNVDWHELETWMNAKRIQQHMTSSDKKDSSGWTGSKSLRVSRDLMRDGWQAGVDMLEHGLTHEIDNSGVEQAEVWETAPVGAFPIIPLYNAGVDEHMLLPSEEHDEPIVNMIVDVACASRVRSKQMMNRGIAIASLINHIEQSGKRVRLQARWGTKQNKFGYEFMIMVKDADEHMDMSRVAFAIGNPSFSRRVCFKMLECVAHEHMGGYGSVLTRDVADDVFYIEELCSMDRMKFDNAQNANEYIRKQWERVLEKDV